jgi:spore coat protein U-like protein
MIGSALRYLAGGVVMACLPAAASAASLSSCAASATAVAFGTYNPMTGTPNTSSGSISVTCSLISGLSLLVAYTISISTGSSGTYTQRKLFSGANSLGYNLYNGAGMVSVWGDGTGGTTTVSDGYLLGLGNVVQSYTVYGKMPAQQNPAAGTYIDNVTVTVSY